MQEIKRFIDNFQQKTKNIKPILDQTESILHDETLNNFQKEQSSEGKAWSPLSQRTLKTKKNTKKLYRTGRLRNSINTIQKEKSITIGSNVAYAAIHQFGGIAGKGAKIPARPYLPIIEDRLPQRIEERIERVIERYLESLVK